MCHFTDTTGEPTSSKHKLTFRQQLYFGDDQKLANLLSSGTKEVEKYDVFVFELCEGNLSKLKKNQITLTQSIEVCKQLIEGLQQLEESNKCHNDLKPENILYKTDENGKISIKIGDFGTADRSGGTPGWTWPKFLAEREPGRSDMYSTGLLILYVMCDSTDLFYILRNSCLPDRQTWVDDFREDPVIELVIDMINLKISVRECLASWNERSDFVEILSVSSLSSNYRIPRYLFDVQHDFAQLNR